MPQLLSRMDQSGWLTPSIADILEHGAAPPGGEDVLRTQAQDILRAMTEQGAPVRILNVRPSPSSTLYIARPDLSGRSTRKQIITQSDIERGFARVAQQHPDWALGYLPKLQDGGVIGLLLRTPAHQPARLRQIMVRNAFREHPSTMALALGMTLEQQPVVRDLNSVGHVLIVGAEATRRPYLWGILLSLVLLNTPTELRLALAGTYSQGFNLLLDTPHVLGRMLPTPREGQRLLDGMVKEIQRRQQWFREKNVTDIAAYNRALAASNMPPLPRIAFLIDSLSDPEWKDAVESWTPSVYDLIIHGAEVGIHLLLTSNHDALALIPDLIHDALHTKILLPTPEASLSDKLRGLPEATHKFVDAVLIENEKEARMTPLELYTISDEEIQRATAYWRQTAAQRVSKAETRTPPAPSGVTTLLPAVRDVVGTQELVAPTLRRPPQEVVAKAAQALSQSEQEGAVRQAQALAAYLGWLSTGALHDILGLTPDQAQAVIALLQNRGVLDNDSSITPRFVRLSSNPLKNDGR